MTDPIADLLTRIRNAVNTQAKRVTIPYSRTKKAVLKVFKDNGYIADFVSDLVPVRRSGPASGKEAVPVAEKKRAVLRIELKYGPDGEKIIRHIRRISKPGRRVYLDVNHLLDPLNGIGLAVMSTSKGIVSQAEAKKLNVGGEVLCEVW
jgi:small subunit ribosomal protein S8